MEQVLADVFRQLPTPYLIAAVRLSHDNWYALIEHDDDLWRERRRALLSYVPPDMYPPELVRDGWISIEMPKQEENEIAVHLAGKRARTNDASQDEENAPPPPPPKPIVKVLVKRRDRLICEAFVKHATQRWYLERVVRSWRQHFARLSVPLEQFWDRKWNEREDEEMYGIQSTDPMVRNRQIDIEEMQRLTDDARHSLLLRIQNDQTDRLREKQEQETASAVPE